MKCYVINLAARPERLAHMAAEFGRFGLAFERIEAVDGKALTARGPANPRLTPGAFGCFHSHLAALARIAAGSEPFGAVFEDDLYFADAFGPLMADTAWIPADADLIKLETSLRPIYVSRRARPIGDGIALHALHGQHMGGGAYVVSRAYAARLAGLDPLTAPASIDALLFDPRLHPFPGTRIHQVVPAVVVQDIICKTGADLVFASDTDFDLHDRRRAAAAAKYAGPLGRLRLATKGARDRVKTWMRDLAHARRHGFDLRRGPIPFAPRRDA